MIAPTSSLQSNPAPPSTGDPSDRPVIHLVAPPSLSNHQSANYGRTTPALLHAAARTNSDALFPNQHNQTLLIGDSTTKTTAQALNIPNAQHLCPLLDRPITLKRRIINQLERSHPPSRIVCWSDELIPLASNIATHFDIPVNLISTKPDAVKDPPQNIDSIRVFHPNDFDAWQDRRHTCQHDQQSAEPLSQRITPPTISATDRSIARAKLEIDDSTIVLGAIADAPQDVDAREFAFLLGLLSVSGYQVLGVVPKPAKNLNQALRHHRGLDQPFRLMTTTDLLPQLLPILDAVIHPTDETSGSTALIESYCKDANLPILHLRHSGKAGFSRAQGSSGRILDQMDEILASMQPAPTPLQAAST